jgi:hypothetical protein
MNILPEDDGSYTATCDKHAYWHFNGAEKIREKVTKTDMDRWLIKRLGNEARAKAALRLHVRLWECATPDTLEATIRAMRKKPNVKVI